MKSIRLSNVILMLISTVIVIYAIFNLVFALKNIFTHPRSFEQAPLAQQTQTELPVMAPQQGDGERYIMAREYNGRIGIFIGRDAQAPARVLDVRVSTLSDYDRALLESGIRLNDEQELAEFVEDYTS